MKRKLLILILCLALVLSSASSAWAFSFSDTGSGELAMAAAVLQGMDVVAGTSATTFNPEGTLTRAQACTMLIKMMGLDSNLSSGAKKTYFSDVPADAWYAAYVNLAYSNGIINGYGNGKFGPNDYISYGQLATIILRMLGYSSSDVGYVWPSDYTSLCEDLGISDDFNVGDNSYLNRGQAALMLYRSLNCKTKDGRQYYYETIGDVASTKEVIVMSVDAEKNGSTGLLLGYSQGQQSEKVYIVQKNAQSETIEGCQGKLLLNSPGNVIGFLPTDSTYKDLEIESAGLSSLSAGGSKYRMGNTVLVLDSTGESNWSAGGYLKAVAQVGSTARLFFDSDGGVKYVYLYSSGNASVGSDESADTRISGYISAVTPRLVSAEKVTIAGCTFEVSESAASVFSPYKIGEKLSVYLDGDGKVCAADKEDIHEKMLGLLSSDGKTVTLMDSGAKLSASEMNYNEKLAGGLVMCVESSMGTLHCYKTDSNTVSGDLDIEAGTVGTTPIAAKCAVYEWTGSGFLCSLDGVRGEASYDFDTIGWTDTIPGSQISWCHLNGDGEVDVIVLNNVTGNCYTYGYLDLYEDQEGIDLGSNTMHAYNRAGVVTNGEGKSPKSICVVTKDEGFCGAAYGYANKNTTIVSVASLSKFKVTSLDALALETDEDGDDVWQATDGNTRYQISDKLQVYSQAGETWSTGISTVLAFLESGYAVSLYYDRPASDGGQIRIAVINK